MLSHSLSVPRGCTQAHTRAHTCTHTHSPFFSPPWPARSLSAPNLGTPANLPCPSPPRRTPRGNRRGTWGQKASGQQIHCSPPLPPLPLDVTGNPLHKDRPRWPPGPRKTRVQAVAVSRRVSGPQLGGSFPEEIHPPGARPGANDCTAFQKNTAAHLLVEEGGGPIGSRTKSPRLPDTQCAEETSCPLRPQREATAFALCHDSPRLSSAVVWEKAGGAPVPTLTA